MSLLKDTNNHYLQFRASGYGDSGLRVLADLAEKNNLQRCQVITFGETEWTGFQRVRQNVEVVEANQKTIQHYRLCDRYLPNKIIKGKKGNFIASSITRELITKNLARGLPWWHSFSQVVDNKDLFKSVSYQRTGLIAMVKHIDWDTETHELFIEACHEALSRRYAKLYTQASELDIVPIEKEKERIRFTLTRCYSYKNFRNFMAGFLIKAGSNSVYANHHPTSRSREYRETYPVPPPSTVYGMLLSLVGETDRYRHCGVKIALALLSEPAKLVTFRTIRKFKRKKLNHPKNSRPDFQEILTGIELMTWVDEGEDKAKPSLCDRITQGFANPASVNRFGALCLGESRDLVNSVDLITKIEPNLSLKFLVQHESGYLSLPYWSGHVNSKNTRWLRYCFKSSRQHPPDSAWTVVKAT